MRNAIDPTAARDSSRTDRNDGRQRLFLSYSRAQFYFAESLAHSLQSRDFDVWFDSQRLTAGSEWAAEIEHGLADSDVLLLVASRQSLESVAVRHEWTTALSQGKTIVVALFDAAELPGELDQAASVDFQRSFDSALTHLLQILGGAGARQQEREATRRRPLAPPVRTIKWALIAPVWVAVSAVVVAVASTPDSENGLDWFVHGYIAFLCAFLWHRMRAFVRRDFRRAQIQIALIVAGAVLPLAAGKALWASAPPALVFVVILLLAVFSLLLALVASWLLQRSPAIFRWLPTGEARARERIHNAAIRSIHDAAPRRTPQGKSTFAVRASVGDRHVARIVARQFAAAGWTQVQNQEMADRELVLVSADSTLDLAHAFDGSRSREAPIVIITSNGVQEAVLGSLARHQWIDFRRRRLGDLRRVAGHLRGDAVATRSVELNEVPERLRERVLPRHLRIVLRLLYLAIAIFVAFVLLLLWLHAASAVFGVFTPARAQEFEEGARAAFDTVQESLPPASPDLQTRLGLEFLRLMLFSPGDASFLALVLVACVIGLGWLANALVGRRLARRTVVIAACILSLGLVNAIAVLPFSELLGLLGIVLVIGELRCAWLPVPERPFRQRAIAALTDLRGWRETANAIVVIFALLWGSLTLMLSFA